MAKLSVTKVLPYVRQGYTAYKIAKELGVTPSAVYAFIKKHKINELKKTKVRKKIRKVRR